MRKYLGLFILCLVLTGCSTKEESQNTKSDNEESSITKESTSTIENQANIENQDTIETKKYATMNEAYNSKYTELSEKYGVGAVVDFEGIGDTEHSYLDGVCVVNLMDFDNDGVDDLFLLYSNDNMTKLNQWGNVFDAPNKNTYEFEIWSYKGNELVQLLQETGVSKAYIYPEGILNPDQKVNFLYRTFLNIYENENGISVIQVYSSTTDGVRTTGDEYTNIYYSNGKVVKDVLTYGLDGFKLNNKVITEEEFDKNVTDYSKILLCAPLSDSNNSKTGLKDSLGIDLSFIISQTYNVVHSISDKDSNPEKSRFHIEEDKYLPLYLNILDKTNRKVMRQDNYWYAENHGYCLTDMDSDGIDELLLRETSSGAGEHTEFYGVVNDEMVELGIYGRSSIFVNDNSGIIMYFGRMGGYDIKKITLENNQLVYTDIESGMIGEGDYPELEDLGYSNYDYAKVCPHKIPFGLYIRSYVEEEY